MLMVMNTKKPTIKLPILLTFNMEGKSLFNLMEYPHGSNQNCFCLACLTRKYHETNFANYF